ncbi:MAG TPA: AAA family ATPase [Acidimicrobiia bacterium]|nr:AAA family ATPase [Acidimicrobiia bacterium]
MTDRSTAIVLFTDLVGSTELRSRLGEDAADVLREQHDALVTGAVEANRGTVVKNLGDGIMATFAGASDAVGAAVATQQAIDRHNRSSPAALEVRIGISAGDVVFEKDDCFGTPVIEAARLCAVAQGGQILASEIVRWMARSGGSTFTPLGSLELKGLPEPVPTVEVGWEPLAQSSVPLPTFLTDIGRIFVGRDGELDRLGQLWKEASTGQLRVALLAGEPGVGKTRLAAELARTVHEEGATVLAGRCDEDLGVPYQPFVEGLRHFADHSSLLADRLGRYGGELVRLVPELAERVPGLPAPLRSDPDTERYRLFDAVAAWLTAASADEPVLLVLDDLQWAAKPTLLLLRHVVRAAGGRVLVLGTYRDTELTHDHPLVEVVADLHRQGGVERLSLSGLDDVGVAAIVEQAAGRSLDEAGHALARAVYQETEGNPFFVREVLRHLVESGVIERGEQGWSTRLPVEELGIPEGVREVVGRRLARLSDDTNQALRIAAVVGPEFELGVVQAAGDLGEEALVSAVEEAAAARVVTEVSASRYRFAHALIRATLYDSLTGARQVTLHRKAAEAIETIYQSNLDDYVPALAHHWAKASAPVTDITRAVEYARRAGDRALAQLAHDEAVNYYASALDLLDAGGAEPADPRRVELLIGSGEAQRRAGDRSYRQTLLDAARLARDLGDGEALARAALTNTRGNIWSAPLQIDAERVEVLEAAITAVGDANLALRARLLGTLALELCWETDSRRRLALSEEALQIASSLDEPATLAHVLLARDYAISAPENAANRLAATAQLLEIAEQLGDPVVASRALSLRFKVAMELADVEEAERSLARNERLVADLGQPILTWATMHHRATLMALRAEAGAETAILAAYEFGLATIGQPDVGFFVFSHRRTFLWDRGRIGEMEEWTRQVMERMYSNREFEDYPVVKGLYAFILVETGHHETVIPIFDELAATGFAHPPNNVGWLMFMTECAWVCARLGRKDCVPRLRSILEPYPDQLILGGFGAWVTGPVAFYLAMLATTIGDWPEADAQFAATAATHERINTPTSLARTRLEWARMLLTRAAPGDTERAHDLLRRALETARALGLPPIERDAVALLSGA